MKSLSALILAGSLFALPASAIETQQTMVHAKTVTKTTVHPKKHHHKKHVTKHVKKTKRIVTHHEEKTSY